MDGINLAPIDKRAGSIIASSLLCLLIAALKAKCGLKWEPKSGSLSWYGYRTLI